MRLLLFSFLTVLTLQLHAQQVLKVDSVKPLKKVTSSKSLKIDSSKTIIGEFNNEAIQKYKEQKDFQYGEEEPKGLSWWDRFWRAFWRWIESIFGGETTKSKKTTPNLFFKYLIIGLSIGLVVFAIIKLVGVDFKLFSKKSKTIDVPYDESLENIHEIDFVDQIEMALNNGNYRLAVRLLYLNTLKMLSDKELIDWQLNKTNQAYVNELADDLQPDFNQLTLNFEYIWYGDFSIDKEAFEQIQMSFQEFNQSVK